MKTLLVILQNAYGVEDGYIPSYGRPSFCESHTGIRLQKAIPDNVNLNIINANPNIGKAAQSNLPPNQQYVNDMIEELQPNIILACGQNAHKTVMDTSVPTILMPHPAYRQLTNQTLSDIKNKLSALL